MSDTKTLTLDVRYAMTMQAYGSRTVALTVPADTEDGDIPDLAEKRVKELHDAGGLIDGWKTDASTASGHRVLSITDEEGLEVDPDGFDLDDDGMRYLTEPERIIFDNPAHRDKLVWLPRLHVLVTTFMKDIQAVGLETVEEDWPDLAATYKCAEHIVGPVGDTLRPAPQADPIQLLIHQHGGESGVWGEHPDHPRDDWRDEVANGDTNQGYWEWVAHEIDIIASATKEGGQ